MKKHHLNYIVLHDGTYYYVFERLGKDVPFDAYNPMKHMGKGSSYDEAVADSTVSQYLIEENPYEVIFSD